jgi:hypothetical protein
MTRHRQIEVGRNLLQFDFSEELHYFATVARVNHEEQGEKHDEEAEGK